jgi:hypothetical protein
MKLLLAIIAATALCTAYGQSSFEAIQGYNNPTAAFWEGTAGGTFTVTNNITVTALGAFNYLFQLNQGTIQVGLWDAAGNLMASNTISSTSPLVNQSRYQSIDPVYLDPNHLYRLGAYSTNGTIYLNVAAPGLGGSVSNSPPVVLDNSALFEGAFAAPLTVTNTPGAFYLGPNFTFENRIPEPAAGLLLCMAGLLFGACGKWRSRSRN